MSTLAFSVRAADWAADGAVLRAIRTEVFVVEQRVPAHLEWDAEDRHAWHVLATTSDGIAVGTGRLLRDGRIGRMAVMAAWRGQGVGAAMLAELIATARTRTLRDLVLHAQTHALGFYTRFGFQPEGEEFMEAGIPHRTMRLRLSEAVAKHGRD